jgi:hypothetical protein
MSGTNAIVQLTQKLISDHQRSIEDLKSEHQRSINDLKSELVEKHKSDHEKYVDDANADLKKFVSNIKKRNKLTTSIVGKTLEDAQEIAKTYDYFIEVKWRDGKKEPQKSGFCCISSNTIYVSIVNGKVHEQIVNGKLRSAAKYIIFSSEYWRYLK